MKTTLRNTLSNQGGFCRMCNTKILLGEEISILVEPDRETEKFTGKPCKPDIHVYHRACMDRYLLDRVKMGKPVSGISKSDARAQ